MWCIPEQERAGRLTGATKKQQQKQQQGPVFASVPVPRAQRPVRVPPQSAVAFPRPASEGRRAEPYTESERRSVAAMMAKLRAGEDVRPDKVERVRGAVSIDDYENEMKLDIAIDRLLDELVE